MIPYRCDIIEYYVVTIYLMQGLKSHDWSIHNIHVHITLHVMYCNSYYIDLRFSNINDTMYVGLDCTSIKPSIHDVSNFIFAMQLLPKTTTHSYPYQLASHSWPLFPVDCVSLACSP